MKNDYCIHISAECVIVNGMESKAMIPDQAIKISYTYHTELLNTTNLRNEGLTLRKENNSEYNPRIEITLVPEVRATFVTGTIASASSTAHTM